MRNGTFETADGVEICIPLPPVTKKNSQRIGYRNINGKQVPFIIPSAKYKQYEKDCGFFLKPLGISEPINIRAVFYMSTRRKVDLTNLNEALHDALVTNGTLEDDNSSIVVGTDGSRVLYDKENPRTEVWITKIEKNNLITKTGNKRTGRGGYHEKKSG